MPTEMKYPEADIVKRLGITSRTAREARKRAQLEQGQHWDRVGRQVCYTEEAAYCLLTELNVDTDIDALMEGKEEEKKGRIKTLLYQRTYRNKTICDAKDPDTGDIHRVRIHPSENWMPGMEMNCQHIEGTYWIHEGRAPRWKGRF